MLHDNARNALLSSMSVPILKILKLIIKSLQYEEDIFACISETLMICKLEKKKVGKNGKMKNWKKGNHCMLI